MWCKHQPQTYKVDYTWILDNFLILKTLKRHLDQKSPIFPDNNIFKSPIDTQFYLALTETNEYLGLNVFNTANSSATLAIIITLGNTKKFQSRIYQINKTNEIWLVKYNDLFAADSKLLPDGNLIINVEITMIGDILCTTQHGHVNTLKVPKCKLSEDFYAPFQTGDFSDVTIETADDHKLKAHKVILSGNTIYKTFLRLTNFFYSARSTVFAAMLSHQMKESQENFIKITDFNENVVTEMLRFIYTGETPNLNELNDDLLAAADKYALDRRKALCADFLGSNLSNTTAIRVYNLADLYNIEELKTAAKPYISSQFKLLKHSLNTQQLITVITNAELLSAEEKSVDSIKDETEQN